MNQSTKLRSCFTLAILLAVALVIPGCAVMIYPHTTVRSKEFRGRVLDAKTFLPIKGAKVYYCEPPTHTTHTDADGYFLMKAVKDFHWISGADGSGYPIRNNNEVGVRITHQDYYPNEYWHGHSPGPMNILLSPKPPAEH